MNIYYEQVTGYADMPRAILSDTTSNQLHEIYYMPIDWQEIQRNIRLAEIQRMLDNWNKL